MSHKVKSWKDKPRNFEAKRMIELGLGKPKVFRDKRDRRAQDHRRQELEYQGW